MRRAILAMVIVATGLLGVTCVVEPTEVTIELVNETSLDVTPNFFASGQQTDDAGLFVDENKRTDFTDRPFPELRSRETQTLVLNCGDEAETIGTSGAFGFDAANLTKRPTSDVALLRLGGDYSCGGTVRFIYFLEGDALRVRVE